MGEPVLELRPEELVARRASGEHWLLLDVREAWEVSIVRIEGAVTIPMAQVPERAAELDRAAGIAVLCHSGVRSAAVANWLASQGFERVANVAGGIDAWSLNVDPTLPRY